MSQEINLLPAAPSRKGFRPTSAAGTAVGVAAAAVCAVFFALYENHLLQAVQREAQGVERALKEARAAYEKAAAARTAGKPDASADMKLAELEAQLQSRQQVLEALKGGAVGTTSGFSQYMLALSRQSVTGVWLTAFDFAAGGNEVTLTGRALSADLVPVYLQRLTQETPLQGRQFASMMISQPVRASDAGARAAPPYLDFEISSEPSQRAAAPPSAALPAPLLKPDPPPPATGALPPPLIKPDPPLGTAPSPQPAKPEAAK